MSPEPPERDEVLAFLARRGSPPQDLEPLTGGAWSSAWAYRAGGEELVVRFGQQVSWYAADRDARNFAGPDLPVPEVREVGTTPNGRAYAISVRHHGDFIEDTPVELAGALAPTLTRLLVAFYEVPSRPDDPVVWHQGGPPMPSWREFLLDSMRDDPAKIVHGWSETLAADPRSAALSQAVTDRIRTLVDACPERRDLLHGDLLHANVLVHPDRSRVTAVLSWKCSVRGDFLYDVAWCTFWAPWHPGLAATDFLPGLLTAPAVRADAGSLRDAAIHHHCYELIIGYSHLGWNVWTKNDSALAETLTRLTEVFDRGPVSLPG